MMSSSKASSCRGRGGGTLLIQFRKRLPFFRSNERRRRGAAAPGHGAQHRARRVQAAAVAPASEWCRLLAQAESLQRSRALPGALPGGCQGRCHGTLPRALKPAGTGGPAPARRCPDQPEPLLPAPLTAALRARTMEDGPPLAAVTEKAGELYARALRCNQEKIPAAVPAKPRRTRTRIGLSARANSSRCGSSTLYRPNPNIWEFVGTLCRTRLGTSAASEVSWA